VTRGQQLPQRAGSLGLNGGGTAAAVPPPKKKGPGTAAQVRGRLYMSIRLVSAVSREFADRKP